MTLTNPQGKLILANTNNQLVTFSVNQSSLSTTGIAATPTQLTTRGLISWWRLEEDNNATEGILDYATSTSSTVASNPPNHATRFGAAPFVEVGVVGNAHVMDGDDYVITTNTSNFNVERTDSWSVSFWFKHQGTAANLINRVDSSLGERGWRIYFLGSAIEAQILHDNSTNYILRDTAATIPSNTWTHFAMTYDGSSSSSGINVYINGALSNGGTGGTLSLTIANSLPLAFGAKADAVHNEKLTGSIDEVMYYNVALTAAEVAQNYRTSISSISTNGLISWWKFDNDYTDTALSDTGVGASPANNGTEVGGTYTFTSTPGFSPQSGKNGFTASTSADYITLPANASLHPASAWTFEFRGVNHIAGTQKSTVAQFYFDNGGSAQGSNGFAIGTTNDVSLPEELRVRVKNSTTTDFSYLTSGSAFPNDTVVYWSIAWDGTVVKVYKNGRFLDSFSYTGTQTYSVAGAAFSGRITQPDGISGMYSGSKMDFARLYNRALTAQEVAQNYTASTPSIVTDGLAAWFKFDGDHTDSGPNNIQLELTGNEKFVDGPGNLGQGIYLDGATYYKFINYATRPGRYTMDGWYRQSDPAYTSTFVSLGKNAWTGPANDSPSLIFNFDPATGNSTSQDYSPRLNLGATQHINTYWPGGDGTNGGPGVNYIQNPGGQVNSGNFGGENVARWHHVVVTYDGIRMKLFVDSVLRASQLVGNPNTDIAYGSSPNFQTIGAQSTGASGFNGCIASLKYYNRALSDGGVTTEGAIATGEIAQNYYAGGGA